RSTPRVKYAAMALRGRVLNILNRSAEAEPYLTQAAAEEKRNKITDVTVLMLTLMDLATAQENVGKHAEAEKTFGELLKVTATADAQTNRPDLVGESQKRCEQFKQQEAHH